MKVQNGYHRFAQNKKHQPHQQNKNKKGSEHHHYKTADQKPGSSKEEIVFREVENMPLWRLQKEAVEAGLNSSGTECQLIRRLKAHYRGALIQTRKWLAKNRPDHRTSLYYDHLVAIDFECTCEENLYDFDNEIIEFPAVLIDVKKRRIKSEFRTFVKPLQTKKISLFCSKLTGISQEEIEQAPKFPDALRAFRTWMRKNGIDTDNKRYAFVTDGPWDFARFFQRACERHEMKIPHDFRVFVNLRRAYVNNYCKDVQGQVRSGLPQPTIPTMLSRFGIKFEGNEHCGIDDARNLANVVIAMLKDNMEIRVNEKLVLKGRLRPWQTEVFHERGNSESEQIGAVENLPKENDGTEEENKINGGENMAKADKEDAGSGASDPITVVVKKDHRPEKPKWLRKLPYTLVLINRPQYFGEQYLDCESCSDGEEEEEEEWEEEQWEDDFVDDDFGINGGEIAENGGDLEKNKIN